MSQFIPNAPRRAAENVPYYHEARSEDGWQGQGTKKSVDTLKAELMQAIGRLGGTVTAYIPGVWGSGQNRRPGFRLKFVLENDQGGLQPGQLDIAALPTKNPTAKAAGGRCTQEEASLRMALYMARDAFAGMWFLRQLSPGFVPMLPWLLVPGREQTISELYGASGVFSHLLPAGEAEFVEGEFTE